MANISDARGTLFFEGSWTRQQIELAVYLLLSQGEISDYCTVIGDSYTDIIQRLFMDFADNEEHAISFWGSGRWAFGANLESLKHWYKIGKERWEGGAINSYFKPEDRIPYEQYLKNCEKLFYEMYLNELYIRWEYYDIEIGMSFLTESLGFHRVLRDEDTGVIALHYTEDIVEDWVCNLKNYCNVFLDGYDEEVLEEVTYRLAHLYKIPIEHMKDIEHIITQHETWYDLSPYPCLDRRLDVPYPLRKAIIALNKLIKENTNDNQ